MEFLTLGVALAALGIKVSFLLSPNLMMYNLHIRAQYLMDFFITFFPDAYNAWVARDGIGTTEGGEVIRDWPDELHTRRTCVIQQFTVLRDPGDVPPNVVAGEWRILRLFWEFFTMDGVSYVIDIPGGEYRIRGRRVRCPGEIYVPELGEHIQWLPVETALARLKHAVLEFQNQFFSARERTQPAQTRDG